jgi:phage protein D
MTKPIFYIELDEKDITTILTPYILAITYTDNDGLAESESDDIQLELADPRNYFRDNPPARGSVLRIKFGYDSQLRNAGCFIVDSYGYKESRSGSTFSIKALAKNISQPAQETKTVAYEGQSLKSIAEAIAARQKLTVDWQGDDISFSRQTQHQKRDLEYIQDLTKRYGYTCKVNNGKLVIHSMEHRFSSGEAYVLTPELITDFSMETSSIPEGQVSADYQDPDLKSVTHSSESTGVKASGSVSKENIRVENQAQSNRITKSKSTLNQMKEQKGSITCIGIPNLFAGGRIILEGYGIYDKDYYLSKVVHNISRSGYNCQLDICINPQKKSS